MTGAGRTQRPGWRWGIAAGALFLLSALVHLPSRDVPFLLDDLVAAAILAPEGHFEFSRVAGAFAPTGPPFHFNDHWRPLGWVSIAIDLAIAGFEPSALRVFAWAWHALSGLLVAMIVARWRRSLHPSEPGFAMPLLAGAAFVAWPGAAEPVVWLSHRFTLLATAFLLGAALMTLRRAQGHGGLVPVILFLLLSHMAKDSALTEAFIVLPFAFAVPRTRPRGLLPLVLAVVGVTAASLLLRRLLFGSFLPTYRESPGGQMEAVRLAIAELPSTLLDFVRPVLSGDQVSMGILTSWVGLGLVGILVPMALVQGGVRVFFPLVFVLLAGLPVLTLGPDLDGSRRLHLPAALLAVLLGAGPRRAVYPLGALVLAWGLTAVWNQAGYVESGSIVREAQAKVRELGAPLRILVIPRRGADGKELLAPTWRGAPAFGPGATHFALYFVPPVGAAGRDVRMADAEEAWRAMASGDGSTLCVLEAPRPQAAAAHAIVLPLPQLEVQAALAQPQEDRPWSTSEPPFALGVPAPIHPETASMLVTVRASGAVARWWREAVPPPDGQPLVQSLLLGPDLVPPSGVPALLGAVGSSAVAGTVEVVLLARDGRALARYEGAFLGPLR